MCLQYNVRQTINYLSLEVFTIRYKKIGTERLFSPQQPQHLPSFFKLFSTQELAFNSADIFYCKWLTSWSHACSRVSLSQVTLKISEVKNGLIAVIFIAETSRILDLFLLKIINKIILLRNVNLHLGYCSLEGNICFSLPTLLLLRNGERWGRGRGRGRGREGES